MTPACFLGIDVGTQGVRVLLADAEGTILGNEERITYTSSGPDRTEQDPETWWQAVQDCLTRLLASQTTAVRKRVTAVSVTSTSGTVIPLDKGGRPLHPAIMYSDSRQEKEGKRCRKLALAHVPSGYTAFNSSSGLPKMVWFANHFPDQAARIETWVHAADYILGKLSGNFRITDHTNALKSGFDMMRNAWPEYIPESLPVQERWLQEVVPSGTAIGEMRKDLLVRWGLDGVAVVAGMTDGCASQVAAGAVRPGDWNTTIGTTLVVKGVTVREIHDPEGRLYCHRHPQGYWMPGGASNTGADWITQDFAGDLPSLNNAAAAIIPTPFLVYPLRQHGERFPFLNPAARGFSDDRISTRKQLFAAGLEGVAYIERLAYALAESLSGEKVKAVYSSGGGSNSDIWLKIRANVLNRPVYKMNFASGALGAAILAASQVHFSNLTEAASVMTRIETCFEPQPAMASLYGTQYEEFLNELKKRGYWGNSYRL